MLYNVVPVYAVYMNQLCVYIYPLPLEPPSHPTPQWETFPEETRFSGLSWAFSLFQLTILYTEDPLVHGWPCSVGHLNTILFRLVKFPRSSFHHTLGSSNQAPHLTAQGCNPPPAAQASLDPFRTLVRGLVRSPGAPVNP